MRSSLACCLQGYEFKGFVIMDFDVSSLRVYKFLSLGVLLAIHDTNRLVALVIHRSEPISTFADGA